MSDITFEAKVEDLIYCFEEMFAEDRGTTLEILQDTLWFDSIFEYDAVIAWLEEYRYIFMCPICNTYDIFEFHPLCEDVYWYEMEQDPVCGICQNYCGRNC